MSFPPINGTPVSGLSTPGTTSFSITLPSGVAAGEVVVLIVSRYIDTLTTSDTGWTSRKQINGTSSVPRATIFTLDAAGGETSVTINGTGSYNAKKMTHVAFRVSGEHATYWYLEASNSLGTSTAPDSGSLAPGVGADDFTWLTFMACDGRAAYSAVPSGYTLIANANGDNNDNNTVAVAYRQANASSEDPGAWTISGSRNWAAITGGIRPTTAVTQSVAGTITPAGTVATQATNDVLAVGTLTPAGAVSTAVESNDVAVDGTITPTGEIDPITVGFADGSFVGTITPAGIVAASQVAFTVDLDGTITPSGDLGDANQVAFTLAGTLTPAGTPGVPTAIEHALAGSVTPAGDVTSGLYEGVTLLLHSNTGSD